MRIVIELDEKIDGFYGADAFTRQKLVGDAIHYALTEFGDRFGTIDLWIENSECDTLVLNFETGDIITRLR